MGGGTGVYFTNQGTGCTVSDNTLTCDSNTTAGIHHGLLSSGSTPALTNNTISGFTNGRGIDVTTGSPTLTKNKLLNGKYGIYVSNSGTPTIGSASDTTSDNIASGNSTAGLYVTGSSAAGTVRQSRFTGNGTGVITKGNSNPNLGDSSQDGKNIFVGNTSYCLWNQSTSGTVAARGNYRGTCDFTICYSGAFDLANQLCTVPSGVSWGIEPVPDAGPLQRIGVYPNPSSGDLRIRCTLDRHLDRLTVSVADPAGRRVRSIESTGLTAGTHEWRWDGRTDEGRVAANGFYFVRIIADGRPAATTKVLLTR